MTLEQRSLPLPPLIYQSSLTKLGWWLEFNNVLIRYGYQDLSEYALTQAMSEEYEKLVEEAKNARRG